MQKKTWSISGLAVELGIDRRTLASKLDGLAPATSKETKGGRVDRRWFLADVLKHLNGDSGPEPDADDALAGFREIIGLNLFPALVDSEYFASVAYNGLQEELNLTPAQAWRGLQIVVMALVYGLSNILGDEDMEFRLPDYLAETGPDAAGKSASATLS